tara:strand:- start:203 stop:550 length:348 start_codon:yes stop_codon:yes gene_type:complete
VGEVAGRFQDSGNSIFNFSGRVLPLIVIPTPKNESDQRDVYHRFLNPNFLTGVCQIGKPKTPNKNTAEKIWDKFQKFHRLKFSLLPITTNKPTKTGHQCFHLLTMTKLSSEHPLQ